ncbi:MAG: phosphotransferase [Nitrospirae bacterium]|nr:phosphotransferase [Nitrospirota bacterium]
MSIFEELASHWGYTPVIAEGEGIHLLADAKVKAREHRCQLALVDMRLVDDSDESDISGLDLIAQIKPASSIVVSGYGSAQVAVQSIHEKGAVDFVGKEEDPLSIKAKLQKEALKISAKERRLKISPTNVLDMIAATLFEPALPAEYHDQIADVFAQLFPEAHRLRLEKMNNILATDEVSTAPRPRSVVLKVYEDDLQPVIVKLARRHKVEKEVSRFLEYIDRRLVGNFIPVLGKHVELWDIGGIKLSYVGNIEQTFARFFQAQSVDKIQACLEKFFTYTWSAHYKKIKKKSNISLFDLYCDVWGEDWYERAQNFQSPDPEKAMGKNLWGRIRAADPVEWLIKNTGKDKKSDVSRVGTAYLAVTHGDLHADNLLVDDSQNAWVIDFERTGMGHALQDFIEIEFDIISRVACANENFPSFYRLCVAIAGSSRTGEIITDDPQLADAETQKILKTISIIRLLAEQCTHIEDSRQYLFGLFFNSIFRATIINAETHKRSQQRTLMLASILCHRLEHWDEPWPPDEWRDLP